MNMLRKETALQCVIKLSGIHLVLLLHMSANVIGYMLGNMKTVDVETYGGNWDWTHQIIK